MGQGSNGAGGSFVPQSRITVKNGASPSLAPLFGVTNSGGTYGVGSSRIENMMLSCYNQCYNNVSGGDVWLVNNTMYTSNPSQVNCAVSGCITDTAPVALYGSLEDYIWGGTYSNGLTGSFTTGNYPAIVISTDTSNHSSGLISIENAVLFGQVYDVGITAPTSGWGFVFMQNDIFEALGNQPAFYAAILTGTTSFNGLTLDTVLVSDSNPGIPLVSLNNGVAYTGIHLRNNTPSVSGPSIQIQNSGNIGYCDVSAASASAAAGGVVNAGGNPVGGCTQQTYSGNSYTGPSSYNPNQGYYSTFWPPFQFSGQPIEMWVTGESNTRSQLTH